jgi:hypothetical protein
MGIIFSTWINVGERFKGYNAVELAAFRSALTADENQKVVEVREDLSAAVKAGASNIIPFPSKEIAKLNQIIWLGNSKCVLGILGRDHPFLDAENHPSTLEGIDSFIGRLCLGQIKSVPEVDSQILEGSAVVFGGPVSTREARLIFGKGDASPLLRVALPFSFRYWDRIAEAVESHTEPWELIVDGVANPAVQECLIVTVLPMGDKDRIVNIAGLCGAGTRAIDLVLRDQHLLERLERETRGLVGWQLFGEVFTDNETPKSLGEVKVREIKGADFDSVRYSVRSQLFLRDHAGHREDEVASDRPDVSTIRPIVGWTPERWGTEDIGNHSTSPFVAEGGSVRRDSRIRPNQFLPEQSDPPIPSASGRSGGGVSGAPIEKRSKTQMDSPAAHAHVAIEFANNSELVTVLDELLVIHPQADIDVPTPSTLIIGPQEFELAKKIISDLKFSYNVVAVHSPNRSIEIHDSPLDTEEGLLEARRELEAKRRAKTLHKNR